MPDTSELIEEVRQLNSRLDHATSAMKSAAEANQTLAAEYAEDRTFRNFIIKALLTLTIFLTVFAGVAGWAAVQVRSEQATESAEQCERSRNLRVDIHAALDAVLDEIGLSIDTEETDEIVERAKMAVRRELPTLNCDGSRSGT